MKQRPATHATTVGIAIDLAVVTSARTLLQAPLQQVVVVIEQSSRLAFSFAKHSQLLTPLQLTSFGYCASVQRIDFSG